MKEQEEAERIIEMYKPHVYPYLGSGMLTNTYDDDVILSEAKQCALIHVNGIIEKMELFKEACASNEYDKMLKVKSIIESK